jgi:hypothetical protein
MILLENRRTLLRCIMERGSAVDVLDINIRDRGSERGEEDRECLLTKSCHVKRSASVSSLDLESFTRVGCILVTAEKPNLGCVEMRLL